MASSATIKILMDLEDRVSGEMKKVQASLDGFKGNVEKMGPTFTKMSAIGTAGFAAITAAVGMSISAYGEAERSQRQLEHAVIGVSKGTKEQVAAISDLSDALQAKAGIDGDGLKMGAAQLSTFGLQSKSVVNLTKSLADLTVNQNGVNASADQYVQSANVLAKALNGQFGILEKSGIRFTEAQQSMILYGTEAEKVKALQEGLNQNLRETTDTLSGVDAATAKASRSFGEITESLGKAFTPAVTSVLNSLAPLLMKISDWIAANPELTMWITVITASLFALVAGIGAIGLVLPAVITGFGLLAAAVGAISLPVVAIIALLTVIGGAIFYLWKNWDQNVSNMKWAFGLLKDVVKSVIDWIKEKFNDFVSWIDDKVQAVINAVKKAISAVSNIPGVSSIVSSTKSVASSIGGLFRAEGGPVSGGSPYIVGEKGPEMFVPGTSGSIIPNRSLATGSGSINIYISGNSFMGKEGIANEIGNEIMRSLGYRLRYEP